MEELKTRFEERMYDEERGIIEILEFDDDDNFVSCQLVKIKKK